MVQEDLLRETPEGAVRAQAEASRELAEDARHLLDRADADLSIALNKLLKSKLGSFRTGAAHVSSSDGTIEIGPFSVVVHMGGIRGAAISIDGVVAVIDAYEELTVDVLHKAYCRARQVKSLTKKPTDGTKHSASIAMTVVIVFARRSLLTLDEISIHMAKLNRSMPAHSWPDMVAVDGKGIVNYTTRLPGEEHLGDFILPAEDHSPSGFTAPLYIYKSIRSGGRHTFNKVASLLAARAAISAPDTPLNKYDTELAELAANGVITNVYQFDLRGNLQQLSQIDIAKDLMPVDLYGIVVGKKALGSIEFRRWQDGGFLTVRGQFPIEPFLAFLRQQKPSIPPANFQMIRGPSVQVSMVLPITESDFLHTLSRFQARTAGVLIKKDTRKLLIQKYADEGTTSPFYGRLMLGLLRVRSAALGQSEWQLFDKLFDAAFTALVVVRDAASAIRSNWETHRDKIASRTIVIEQGRRIQITESIDKQLKKETEVLVTGAVRTLKSCMQVLTKHLGSDIGFLFKGEGAFNTGVLDMATVDTVLASYLAETRKWSEPLILLRNSEIEHGLGADFRITYDFDHGIAVREPTVQGQALSAFADHILDRLSCFVEEITIHLLQKRVPIGTALTEVSVGSRTPTEPERFQMTTSIGGLPAWVLTPHQKRFEEC